MQPLFRKLARSGIASVVAVSVAVPVVTLAGGAAVAGTAAGPSAAVRTSASQSSYNWSGYVKTGSGLTSASANFRVPTLLTTYNGTAATWVGLDGATVSDGYLIQTGIEEDVVNHKASYYAWWEVITPTNQAPEIKFTTLAIRPGDSISASVVKGTSGHWTMTIKDNTTARSASKVVSFAGRGLSAEWIQEDTVTGNFISTAPNWQSVSFTSARVNGARPNLSSTQAVDIVSSPGLLGGLLGGKGTKETATGAPNSTRDGFSVKWLATGTRTPA